MNNRRQLLIASGNAGKLKEMQEIMANSGVTCVSLADVGLADMEVRETGSTFEANALLKARAYAKASKLATLADDSGLAVDALDGAPGIYSARYGPTPQVRIEKLLFALREVPQGQRQAHFVSVAAVVTLDQVTLMAEGTLAGQIGMAPRGTHGFGYDPVFLLPDGRTLAEVESAEKNIISHRGRALAKLEPLLRCLFGEK